MFTKLTHTVWLHKYINFQIQRIPNIKGENVNKGIVKRIHINRAESKISEETQSLYMITRSRR